MVWWNGRKVRLVEGKEDKATEKRARDKLADLRYEARHNPPAGSEPTVASVIDAYIESASKRLAQSTQDVNFYYLQSFAETHGWREVRECSASHVEQWLYGHEEWASDWTKNLAVRQVQTAFNWAHGKAKLIAANPFKGFTHRPGAPRRDMTADEFQAILRATKNGRRRKKPTPGARFRQLLIFLWYTGCRPGEAAKLKWTDIDFERNAIVLVRHKTARTQRVARPRVVPLHPVVMRLLRWIRKLNQPGELVFLNHRRTPWNKNSLSLRVQRSREAAGVPDDVKLYGMRHAFGTRAIVKGGLDIKTVAELMGHTTTRMTEHYLHLSDQAEHLADAMLRVNARR
jgi:integrase